MVTKCARNILIETTILINVFAFWADKKIAEYIEEGNKLDRYLFSRHVNLEQKDVYVERNRIKRQLQAEQKNIQENSLRKGEICKTAFKNESKLKTQ